MLDEAQIAPRPLQAPLPIWIAVGGTPQSAVRAGIMGLPMNLGIIGGASARFAPLVDLYRNAGARAGHDPATLKVAVTSYIHWRKRPRRHWTPSIPIETTTSRRWEASE